MIVFRTKLLDMPVIQMLYVLSIGRGRGGKEGERGRERETLAMIILGMANEYQTSSKSQMIIVIMAIVVWIPSLSSACYLYLCMHYPYKHRM